MPNQINSSVALRTGVLTGVDEHWVGDPNGALVLQDATWDERGGWMRCGGHDQVLPNGQGDINPFAGQGKIQSMFWFSQHNGAQQFLLWEGSTRLAVMDWSNGGFTEIVNDRYSSDSPWQHTQYLAVGNNCYVINGVNDPIRFDGIGYERAGYDSPAPSVTAEGYGDGFIVGTSYANVGLGTAMVNGITAGDRDGVDGGGEYAYKLVEVSYLNGVLTMSPASTTATSVKWKVAFEDVAVAADRVTQAKYFVRVNVPDSQNAHTTERWLFRTVNTMLSGYQDGTRFYRCAILPGNHEVVWVDHMNDQLLLANPILDELELGPWPSGAKYVAPFKGRIWLAGMPGDPNAIRYSHHEMQEVFPTTNRFRLGQVDSGEVTGLYATRNALLVFKRRGVFLIMERGDGTFTDKQVTLQAGCVAPNTICDVPGLGVMFVAEDGIWAFTGSMQEGDNPGAITRVDAGLVDYWLWRVNRQALMNACAKSYHKDKETWVSIPIDGAPENAMVLVYHWVMGQWSFRPYMRAGCLAETHDHRGYMYIGSNDSTSHPGLYVYSHGYNTKHGTALDFQYRSVWLGLGGVYENVTATSITARMLAFGSNSVTMTAYVNRRDTAAGETGDTRQQVDPEYRQDQVSVWDTAIWTTGGTWPQARPTTIRWDVDTRQARELQYVISTSNRCELLGVEVKIANPQARQVATMNSVLATGSE